MERKVVISKAKPKDALHIRKVHVASIKIILSKYYPPTSIQVSTRGRTLEEYIKAMHNGEEFFIAKIGKKIVGFISIKDNEIKALYMHPQFIAKGIGKKLLQTVECWAIKKRKRKLILRATINAKNFYKANGYKVVRRSTHILRDGKTPAPVYIMQKHLIPKSSSQ